MPTKTVVVFDRVGATHLEKYAMPYQLAELDKWVAVNGTDNQVFAVESGQYVTLAARAEPALSEYSEPPVAGLPAALWVSFAEPENAEVPDPEWEPDFGTVYFISKIGTYEEVQFFAPAGYFKLWAFNQFQYGLEGEANVVPTIWVYTGTGDNWTMEPVNDESFARVMDRAPRNEEFDKMMQSVMYNVERRLAQAEDNHGRRIAQINARHQADLEAIRAERESAAGGGTSGDEPPASGGAPDEGAGKAKGGKAKPDDVA